MINTIGTSYSRPYQPTSSANSCEEGAKPQNTEEKKLGASTSQVKQLKAFVPKPSTLKKAWDKFKNWFNSSPKAQKILEKIEKKIMKHFFKETIKDVIIPKAEENSPVSENGENNTDSANTILYRA